MSSVPRVQVTAIAGVLLLRPHVFADERGCFYEIWNNRTYSQVGIDADFVQDNLAVSARTGTVRGLHFQHAPMAQAKLVWVARGSVLGVVVDLREGSETRGHHVALPLSAETGEQLFVPRGMAHGYCTLQDDTVVGYKVDAPWSPDHEDGLAWNDPALAIDWPVRPDEAVLSEKDRGFRFLAERGSDFSII